MGALCRALALLWVRSQRCRGFRKKPRRQLQARPPTSARRARLGELQSARSGRKAIPTTRSTWLRSPLSEPCLSLLVSRFPICTPVNEEVPHDSATRAPTLRYKPSAPVFGASLEGAFH